MSKPKVYVNRKIAPDILTLLEEKADVATWDSETQVPRTVLLREIAEVDGLLNVSADRIDEEILDAAPRLRVISNVSVGYDNLNLLEMTKRGIAGTNTPGILTETTADLTFGLLLDAARRITEADRFVKGGKWKGWRPSLLLGQEVYGMTLGIIGMGRIGEAVARRAGGFGMKVLYCNRRRNHEAERALGCEYAALEELIAKSDFICVLAPASPDRRPIIRREHFRSMKRTAILINTSRGCNVEETALIDALREGWIAAAGLDVFEQEPLAADHPLLSLDNAVLTPHIGSASVVTRKKMAAAAIENLIAVLQGERPEFLLNPEVYLDRR